MLWSHCSNNDTHCHDAVVDNDDDHENDSNEGDKQDVKSTEPRNN